MNKIKKISYSFIIFLIAVVIFLGFLNPLSIYCQQISLFGIKSILSQCSIVYFFEGMTFMSLLFLIKDISIKYIILYAILFFNIFILIIWFSSHGNIIELFHVYIAYIGKIFGMTFSIWYLFLNPQKLRLMLVFSTLFFMGFKIYTLI